MPDDWPREMERLLAIARPLEDLWVLGEIPEGPRVAVVGTREPDHTGLVTAARVASAAVRHGWVVVSGGARGIDTAAHEATLRREGRTVVVTATGPGDIYPVENADLFSRVTEQKGGLVTESGPGSPVFASSFLRRNRLIAALSEVVVVVQAGSRSGALNTARWASMMGIRVMAVPGSPLNPRHAGTNRLLARQGARMVGEPSEIFRTGPAREEDVARERPRERDPLLREILAVLGTEPVTVDQLQEQTGRDVRLLQQALFVLERKGAIGRTTGARYVQVFPAREETTGGEERTRRGSKDVMP